MIAATTNGVPEWGIWVMLLVAVALAPFVLSMVTSFVKLVVVAGILRTALGTPQIPPGIVVTGLAMILTVHVMWPVGRQVAAGFQERQAAAPDRFVDNLAQAAHGPMRSFLEKHSRPDNRKLFTDLHAQLSAKNGTLELAAEPSPFTDLTVLVPAFVLTELTEAFQIAFLIFIPFLVIDLVVSSVLLAVGMQYLQPTTVSLPLKLLFFVFIDGWKLIIQGVILSYA